MFNPAPYQPLSVYFDLRIGGLEKIYEYPNTPLELEVTFGANNSFVMTLFDEVGWEIEPYIWRSRDPETLVPGGTMQWGYKGSAEGVDSPVWPFQIDSYVPRYRDNAFYLTIYGQMSSLMPMASSNQASGTVDEILGALAKIYDFDLTINPPFGKDYMQENGSSNRNSTEKREITFNKFAWESDWRYINRVLSYCRDQQGKPGYRAVMGPAESGGGKRKLFITKPVFGSADYTYTVQDRNSVVVDWNPNYQFTAIINQDCTQFNGHRTLDGYTMKSAMDQRITQKFQNSGNQLVNTGMKSLPPKPAPSRVVHTCAENMEQPVVFGACRSRNRAARSSMAGIIPELYAHITNWAGSQSAELEVCGDPKIFVISENNIVPIVEVNFYTPINYFNTFMKERHYTSGLWFVDEVTHRIGLGRYTTVYSLSRPGSLEEPQSGGDVPK